MTIRHQRNLCLTICGALALFGPDLGRAQLAECAQIDLGHRLVDAAGGCISKPLSQQVGSGQGDAKTPWSSIYLIKRDPARAIRRGRQLFQRKFTVQEGLGPRVDSGSAGDITLVRRLGAGLSDSCAACHGRPRGSAGAGGDVATFPDSRDAPHLFGLGLIEMLADEMTADLRNIRARALREVRGKATTPTAGTTDARRPPAPKPTVVTRHLVSKGVNFGRITVFADGRVDTSGVRGVDPDLRVKPFLHQGVTASIREFIVGALHAEMGLQAWDPVLCAVTDPARPEARTSAAGFAFDPALVDYLEFYLLNYFKPGQYRVSRRAVEGAALMQRIGCNSCHVRNLEVRKDRRVADVDTVYDPERGEFNDLFATVYPLFTQVADGDAYPQLVPVRGSFVVENVFTDLKRHDLGPAFHERDFDGTRITMHVTEPLWGVGTTAPYGHDGRSVTLDSVIRRHGGEAARVTSAYLAIGQEEQGKIIDFLQTLVLFPPDDTASNLNPGVPGSADPQNPANHGSINLGALFQVGYEGEE